MGLCYIPNIHYYGIQAKLNRGDIYYEDNGLLDRTHLRWFTRKIIIHLFKEAGFFVEEIQGVRVPNQHDQLGQSMAATLAKMQGVDPEQAARDALAFQYVIRARSVTH